MCNSTLRFRLFPLGFSPENFCLNWAKFVCRANISTIFYTYIFLLFVRFVQYTGVHTPLSIVFRADVLLRFWEASQSCGFVCYVFYMFYMKSFLFDISVYTRLCFGIWRQQVLYPIIERFLARKWWSFMDFLSVTRHCCSYCTFN